MADDNTTPPPVTLGEGEVAVDQKMLTEVLANQQKLEQDLADEVAKRAGLEELFQKGADTIGEKGKLREKKNFEPAFRTVTLKQYPIAGDIENLGYVVGWSNRGAYQKVDKSGVAPQIIDYIDILFLDHERNEEGKLQVESVPLLSLLNSSEVKCKVIEIKDYAGRPYRLSYPRPINDQAEQKMPTGEEINVTTFDPKHGLMETGDVIDGFVGFTDLTYVIQIPGRGEYVEVDSKYLNV